MKKKNINKDGINKDGINKDGINKNINKFYVINWSFNDHNIEFYDVLPYLRNCIIEQKSIFNNYKRTKAYKNAESGIIPYDQYRKFPNNKTELKEFIDRSARYMWWSRCQYEILVSDWPSDSTKIKIDIYQQVKANLDIITNLLADEFNIV